MVFKKGQSGNISGRPRGTGIKPLLEAIRNVEEELGLNYWEVAVKKSLKIPTLMSKIIDKLTPSLEVQEHITTKYKIVVEQKDEDGYDNTSDQTKELATVNSGQSV